MLKFIYLCIIALIWLTSIELAIKVNKQVTELGYIKKHKEPLEVIVNLLKTIILTIIPIYHVLLLIGLFIVATNETLWEQCLEKIIEDNYE